MTSLVGAEWWRLPVEMQQRDQWCLAGPDKAPYLAGPNGPYHASPVTGPWMDFETACNYALAYGWGIGYIITGEDPYTCIDMDVKDIESRDKGQPYPKEKWTTQIELDFYQGIMQFADSYTELSRSGKGLHVWVKGDIGAGRRGKGIEVYSRERFIVCTGQPVSSFKYHLLNSVAIPVVHERQQFPIKDGSMLLQSLTQELGLADTQIELEEVEAELTDDQIWQRATTAGNKDKFCELCAGRWQQYGFPSQSEADLALMSMFTFYSKSNEQCRRLFRATVLGQRDKAVKNDVYLNRTLEIIRARQAKAEANNARGEALAQGLLAQMDRSKISAMPTGPDSQHVSMPPVGIDVDPNVASLVQRTDQTQHTVAPDNHVDFQPPEVEGLEWPPGLVGAIAGFIYRNAPRPVKEVAIVAALGLMAGITGKAYNVGQTGLNLYIVLVARSAIGKEAMHSGIGHILRAPCGPAIRPFVDYQDHVSAPALIKALGKSASMVNVSGEWGHKLARMADGRDTQMQGLRAAMTNLYQKSGVASVAGGLSYSNKDQNVETVSAVAYTMIGETTPGTFYDALTDTMMADGFLSRFNIVEYNGERPAKNRSPIDDVPGDISATLGNIASHAAGIQNMTNVIQVKTDAEAEVMLDEFDLLCDEEIRIAGSDEALRQMWNRAHLKALRVAGVLAASDNHINPCINASHAAWALAMVKRDVDSMRNKVKSGEIGGHDSARAKKLNALLVDFLKGESKALRNVKRPMIEDGIVPRSYLQQRTGQLTAFKNHRMGATKALDDTLRAAIDNGQIMEVDKAKAVEMYNYHGRCFRVLEVEQ